MQKGEILSDTISAVGCYADAIVIRHPDIGSAQLAAKFSPVPLLNAGDGIGEHPTQVCEVFLIFTPLSQLVRVGITGGLHNPVQARDRQWTYDHFTQ